MFSNKKVITNFSLEEVIFYLHQIFLQMSIKMKGKRAQNSAARSVQLSTDNGGESYMIPKVGLNRSPNFDDVLLTALSNI